MNASLALRHAEEFVRGKRVLVVGIGRSGLAAVNLCLRVGAHVTVTDSRAREALADAVASLGEKVTWELGGHQKETFLKQDLILLSPGVPLLPELDEAREKQIPILGELEFSARFVTAPIIAITGTNGKSTTTELIGALLRKSGKPLFCGGNLGTPLAEYVLSPLCGHEGIVVVEVSSFQLETVATFHAHIALLLNITADHLDRYPSFAAYAAAKGRLFERQRTTDFAIVNGNPEQQICRDLVRDSPATVLTFHAERPHPLPRYAAWYEGDRLHLRLPLVGRMDAQEESYDRNLLRLPGAHNTENALAALLAARLMGITPHDCEAALRSFGGLPHRVALVRELNGVRYYDDSKATNVDSVVQALRGFRNPVVLIAGGRDKGGDYAPLTAAAKKHCRVVLLIGEAAPLLEKALGSEVPSRRMTTLEEAVYVASTIAKPKDSVLLSPACSSFDMFRNYEHRAEVFTEAVLKLE